MGNYYDYRSYFSNLITNTETIIDNQEEIKTKLDNTNNTISLLTFMYTLVFVLSIIRNVMKSR